MAVNNKSKTWMDAKRIYGGVHSVPGSFGVNAMATVALYMLNMPIPRDTTVFAYTNEKRMLLVLYVNSAGGREMTKYYPPSGHRFLVPDALEKGKGPSVTLTASQIRRLPDMVEDTRPRLPNKGA
jgi:hypothetical protein